MPPKGEVKGVPVGEVEKNTALQWRETFRKIRFLRFLSNLIDNTLWYNNLNSVFSYDCLVICRQIKNRHGQTLAIMNNGEVRGVPEEAPANKNAVLEFIPTEPPGAYRIRGIQANLYLAMNAKGKALKSSYFLRGVVPNSPLHVGISLRSALKGTLSGSLSVTLADESWKSPLIEDKKYN